MDGEWESWSYGLSIKGWTLQCGRFTAEIRQTGGGNYYLTINRHTI